MARESRPPGFDMTYKPEGSMTFGPPLKSRLPALVYLAFATLVGLFILYGQLAPSGSRAFQYVVEGDRHRVLPASVCGAILFGSAIAAVLRAQMRGVVVHPEGIETRELLALGWPRVRRLTWSQIDRLFVPSARAGGPVDENAPKRGIRLDLWDGTNAWLPEVANLAGLAMTLEKVALARAIPIVGRTGLLDEEGQPLDG
jgi:hypothetical protein